MLCMLPYVCSVQTRIFCEQLKIPHFCFCEQRVGRTIAVAASRGQHGERDTHPLLQL